MAIEAVTVDALENPDLPVHEHYDPIQRERIMARL